MPPLPFETSDLDRRDEASASDQDRCRSMPSEDGARDRRPIVSRAHSRRAKLGSSLDVVDAATNVTEHSAPSGRAPASARADATSNDSNGELLVQIRMLRADQAEGICASARVQILIARWQVQELRLIHLDRERAETASKRLEVARMRTRCTEQLDQLEHRLIGSGSQNGARQGVEVAIGRLKAQIASHQATERSLRSEEQVLLNAMSTEQVSWRDVNSRLDEIERRLPGAVAWPLSSADRTVTERRLGYQVVPRRRKPGKKGADRSQVSGSR
jgi:hypothetical protein